VPLRYPLSQSHRLYQPVPPQRSFASHIVKPAGVLDTDPRITLLRTIAWLLQVLLLVLVANGSRLLQLTITLILAILAILEEGQPWIRFLTVYGGLILPLDWNRVLFLCSVIFIILALAFPLFTNARDELFGGGR
jgi:hypothetical protein